MKKSRKTKPSCSLLLLGSLAGLAVVISLSLWYRPDRPVPHIVPGSSSEPSFVVQIIRPRLGLPLGGILPPRLFGLEERLTFSSSDAGTIIGAVGSGRIELGAEGWELVLEFDPERRVTPGTQVVFEFVFEERLRRVRCRPGDPAVGVLSITSPRDSGEISGNFDIELPLCEDADTGQPLDWPPRPLVLHGSFDRLAIDE